MALQVTVNIISYGNFGYYQSEKYSKTSNSSLVVFQQYFFGQHRSLEKISDSSKPKSQVTQQSPTSEDAANLMF